MTADASLRIREAITFRFHGSHQGIFRTIPVRYTRTGLDFALRLDEIHVFGESFRPLKSQVSYSGRYVKIKAWVPGAVDAERTVTILYRVRRGLLAVDDHDELYWNVTGNEWDVPIRQAEAVVALPSAVPMDTVRAVAYTGPLGGAGEDYAEERAQNFLTFRANRPLRPREGLTIAVAWPPGHVGRPSIWREAAWFLGDNWPLGLPLLAFLGALATWRSYGRDPAANRSIKPEYAPPRGLAPAEAGALVDERAEPRDVIATLVDLAVRGYIRIEQTTVGDEPDFLFRRLRPVLGDRGIRPFELFVLAKLFGSDWTLNMRLLSEVRRDYDNVFPPIRDEIYRTMVRDGIFPASPSRVRAVWAAVAVCLLGAAGFAVTGGSQWLGARSLPLAIGLAASGLVVLGFSRVMPRKTWRGVQALVHVRGFQEFLERAEKDRLARMPADTLHVWLPWAIALGVSERWIWNFEGLKVADPTWFSGDEGFSLQSYDRALKHFSQRTQEAIMTSRRSGRGGRGSSGFSGGSSGGGMGGGGGGTF